MSLRAPEAAHSRPGRRRTPWLLWWLAPSSSAAWRYPLLVVFLAGAALYAFRGLVKMSFIFIASAILSFVFAPILLPLAFLPAFCFYFALRRLPELWRDAATSTRQKGLTTAIALPATWLLAAFIDLLEIIAVRGLLGITDLPRLAPDFF